MFLLLLATVLSFCSVHSSLLGKYIFKWINRPTKEARELISQKKILKSEQSQISMTDSFVSFSKLQRRINKIDQQLAEQRSEKNSITIHLGLTYGLKVLLGLVLFILSIYYRYTPVLVIDKKLDLTPFSGIISYPNGENMVSFHFWVLCSSAVARLIKI